jgi:hypothetical protein
MFFGRGGNKIQADYTFTDFYKEYKKSAKKPINKKDAREIIQKYNTEMLKKVIYDGFDFPLRPKLGSIRIRKFDNSLKLNENGEIRNKLSPNWTKTVQLWKNKYGDLSPEELKEIEDKPIVYHLNEHTDGIIFKWFWDKVTCTVPNQSAYSLSIIRQMKREAAQAWKKVPSLKDVYYS